MNFSGFLGVNVGDNFDIKYDIPVTIDNTYL
jgi:hypothetical protein